MSMKKRPDNRKRSSGKRKATHMQLRLDGDEKRAFEDAANLAGLALSAWVRERLRWAATKELQAANCSIPFLHHLEEE